MTRFTLTLGALLSPGLLSVALAQPPVDREPPPRSRHSQYDRRERDRDEDRSADRELDRLQGTWGFAGQQDKDGRMQWDRNPDNQIIFDGTRWSRVNGGRTEQAGDLRIVRVGPRYTYVDLWQAGSDSPDPTYRILLRIDGDTLHYCFSSSGERPRSMETSAEDGSTYYVWRRARR